MDLLFQIPESIFETFGVIFGFCGCLVIAIQVYKEYRSKIPSSLSMGFLIGWIFIYLFWALYGLRFGTLALWLSNCIAVIIQTTLLVIVLRKRTQRL